MSAGAKRRRVVLVEDDTEVRSTLVGILTRADYEVETAATVREACSLLERPSHALITDIWLPDGNGLEILRAIDPDKRPQRVIAISGEVTGEQGFTLGKLEVDAFLPKPFTADRLLDLLGQDVPDPGSS